MRASLPVKQLTLPRIAQRGRTQDAFKGERRAYCASVRDFIPHAVYDRYRLSPGAELSGPAIVEERESTVIIGEHARARVDEFGFLWIDLPKERSRGDRR